MYLQSRQNLIFGLRWTSDFSLMLELSHGDLVFQLQTFQNFLINSFHCITSMHLGFQERKQVVVFIKGALSDLRQFLATESPLKRMKNAFYFTLKALLALKIFKFFFLLFDHVKKGLDQKGKLNFKICDVMTWLTNNCNTHIDQYLKK